MTQSKPARAASRSGDGAGRPASSTSKRSSAAKKQPVAESAQDELSPRELRRRQRIDVGREQVLDKAEELFGFNGYNATSLEQVAKGCEFSVGALYMFFDSKQDLLEAVLDRRGKVQLAAMRDCLTEDVSGSGMLARVVSTVIDFHRRYPGFGRLSMRLHSPGLEKVPASTIQENNVNEAMDIYATAIERAQQEGTVREGDAHQLARIASGMVTAHHSLDPRLTGEQQGMDVDELLDIIANALSVSRRGRSRTTSR